MITLFICMMFAQSPQDQLARIEFYKTVSQEKAEKMLKEEDWTLIFETEENSKKLVLTKTTESKVGKKRSLNAC